ncbi:MAG: YbbR-like domain-containing protein [Vicinamibacterales bacterium]|jgi:YbbR domain-containing protein
MAWHPFRNVGLKIVATALATLLWLTVGSDPVVERSVRVPLVYRNVPLGLEIATGAPDSVEVNLRGRASEITGDPGDVSLSIDLRDARAGSRLYHLRTDQVTTPIGMEATQVFPGSVMLTLDTTSERMAPVRPTVDGTPGEGFVVREITVDPREVLVVGPQRAIEALTEAITETVMIDGATSTVTRTVSVGVAEASLRLKEPRTARVTVVIVKESGGGD